jgi:hypothetical protein
MPRRVVVICLAALVVATLGRAAADQVQLTRRDADSLLHKLARINQHAVVRTPQQAARSTTISERELNAYLRYHARNEFPAGVIEPYLWIVGDGRVAGRAIVDLDTVRQQKERGWTELAGYLTGRVPVQATGILKTHDGVGQFFLESAEIGGITVPKTVVQEIVSYYTRTPEQPQGVSLEAPFQLPSAIREVRVAKGQALIVQ